MNYDPTDQWNPDLSKYNSEINIKDVECTIDDLKFNQNKVLVCGRGAKNHPKFFPRFSVPTVNIDSDVYVSVDMSPDNSLAIRRKGSYALATNVDPLVPKRVNDLGGSVYWFSPDYLNYGIPKLVCGKHPYDNSGLAAISLASYLNAKQILISGIKLDGKYTIFSEGKDIVFNNLNKNGTKIYSTDGILADKITFELWEKL